MNTARVDEAKATEKSGTPAPTRSGRNLTGKLKIVHKTKTKHSSKNIEKQLLETIGLKEGKTGNPIPKIRAAQTLYDKFDLSVKEMSERCKQLGKTVSVPNVYLLLEAGEFPGKVLSYVRRRLITITDAHKMKDEDEKIFTKRVEEFVKMKKEGISVKSIDIVNRFNAVSVKNTKHDTDQKMKTAVSRIESLVNSANLKPGEKVTLRSQLKKVVSEMM